MSGGKSAAAGKSRTKKGRGLEEPEGNGHAGNGKAPAPAAAELRLQFDQVRAAQAELKPQAWADTEKKRKLDKQARELAPLLEAAELREMPAPPTGSALAQFTERDVSVAAIRVTGNHREDHDEVELARLAHLIKSSGGLQQRIGLREAGDGTFELVWGSRRLAATKLNGDEEIPAKVYSSILTPDDVETLRSIDNLGKKDLSHVERALAVARNLDAVKTTLAPMQAEAKARNYVVLDETALARLAESKDPAVATGARLQREVDAAGGLHAYVGRRLGRPERWVKDNAYVSELGGEARKLLAADRISVGHARELAKLKDTGRSDEIAGMVARNENGTGGATVADCRRMVVEAMCDLSRVPWDLHTAFGKDERKGCAGYACSACPFNSKNEPDLFDGVVAQNPERGVCTNPACFEVKEKIATKKLEEAVAAARKEKKEHKVELTVRGLGAVISKFRELKPESLVRRVKKVLEPQERKPSASKSSMYGRQLSPAEKALADAKNKFEEAERIWSEAQADKLNEAMAGVPGRLTLFELLSNTKLFEQVKPWQDDSRAKKKAAEVVGQKRFKDLVALLKSPSMDAIAILEKETQRLEGVEMYEFRRMVPEARALIGGVLGVQLDSAPELNTFLQDAKAKLGKPADDHTAAAEHHKQLKAKKGKKKPTVLPPAGDEEDEDAELAGVGADDEED